MQDRENNKDTERPAKRTYFGTVCYALKALLREAGFVLFCFIQTYQEGQQARHEVQKEGVPQFLQDLIEYLDLDIKL